MVKAMIDLAKEQKTDSKGMNDYDLKGPKTE